MPRIDELLRRALRSDNAAAPANAQSGFTPPPATLRNRVMAGERERLRNERLGVEPGPSVVEQFAEAVGRGITRAGEGELATARAVNTLDLPPLPRIDVPETDEGRRALVGGLPDREPRTPRSADEFLRSFGPNTAEAIDEARATRAARDEREAAATTPEERGRITGEAFRENLGAGLDVVGAGVEDVFIDPIAGIVGPAAAGTGGFFGGLFPGLFGTEAEAQEPAGDEPTGTEDVITEGEAPIAGVVDEAENFNFSPPGVAGVVAPGIIDEGPASQFDAPPVAAQVEGGSNGSFGGATDTDFITPRDVIETPMREREALQDFIDVIRGTSVSRVPLEEGGAASDIGLNFPIGFNDEDARAIAALNNLPPNRRAQALEVMGLNRETEVARANAASSARNAQANELRAINQGQQIVDLPDGTQALNMQIFNAAGELETQQVPTGGLTPITNDIMQMKRDTPFVDALGNTTSLNQDYLLRLFRKPDGSIGAVPVGLNENQAELQQALADPEWPQLLQDAEDEGLTDDDAIAAALEVWRQGG